MQMVTFKISGKVLSSIKKVPQVFYDFCIPRNFIPNIEMHKQQSNGNYSSMIFLSQIRF